jgi:hypothetical protein
MLDATTPPDLPTPDQMRALNQALDAAWNARRLREASRGILVGSIAMSLCVISTVLVVMHSQWAEGIAPFLSCGILLVYFVGLHFSIRWLKQQRGSSPATVVDQTEEVIRTAAARPMRAIPILLLSLLVQAAASIGWFYAFRHMSNEAILASLSVGPLLASTFFVYRFVSFRFWEDLVFAGCVILAFVPMFFVRRVDVSFLSFVAIGLTAIATVMLQRRWTTWTQSLEEPESETGIMEAHR